MTIDSGSSFAQSSHELLDRSGRRFELLAPTFLEYLTTRTFRRDFPVRYAGMRLSRWRERDDCRVAVVCGLAGSLVPSLRPGDVFIPDKVSIAGEHPRACDPDLVESLHTVARSLGFRPVTGHLLTAPEMVAGSDRELWARRGFVAADMEAGLIPTHLRFATVRVILDAPSRSISAGWTSPARAVLSPSAWSELIWLARAAPVYARRASRIAGAGLRHFRDQGAD